MKRTAWWMLLVAAVFLASCETRTPEGIVSPDEMEDLLYDYHLAQSMARQAPDSTAYRYRLYTEAVYRKYGIDAAQFDSSMAWYTRHSDRLYKIYESVNRRLVEDVGGPSGYAKFLLSLYGSPRDRAVFEGDGMYMDYTDDYLDESFGNFENREDALDWAGYLEWKEKNPQLSSWF